MKHVISVIVHNKPGVLSRVSGFILEQIQKQLYKLIDVIKVIDLVVAILEG